MAAPFVSLLTPYSLYRVPLLRIQEIRISHAGIWGGAGGRSYQLERGCRVFWILREVGTPSGNRYKNPKPKSRMKYGFCPRLFPLPCTLYVRNCLLRWRRNWLPAGSRFPCLKVIDSGVSRTWQIDASYTARSPHPDCPSTSRCSSPLGGVLTSTAAHG